MSRAVALSSAMLLLAACGGGGGGSSGSSPTPVDTPTPTAENGSPAGPPPSDGPPPPPPPPSAPSAVSINASEDAGRGTVKHAEFGAWLESHGAVLLAGGTRDALTAAGFTTADTTPLDQMPSSGTASYRGDAVARETANGSVLGDLVGSFSATADFSAGTVAGAVELADAASGAAWGKVAMDSLEITGNSFTGAAGSSHGHTGHAGGDFMGADAADIGGGFELHGATTVMGVFSATSR